MKSPFTTTADYLESIACSQEPMATLDHMDPVTREEVEGVLVWAKAVQKELDKVITVVSTGNHIEY